MNGASEFTPTPPEVDDEELELGLSLGGCGKGPAWGDYCRFLTAKDFPVAGLRASPGSSVSSSSSPPPLASGTKRASTTPPNQVVVGWPPVRSFRMNTLASSQTCKDSNEEEGSKEQERKPVARGRASASTRFVKVNMDGDPIGRKVDLSAHCSYGTLALALETMFHRPTTASTCGGLGASNLLDGSSEFALTYEDKDGDWMLVGDVPWGMFLDTVRRLRIMRTSDANGLAPRFEPSEEASG